MPRPRRILTVGHSYVVALNRRLAHEMARVGRDRWQVTAVSPTYFHGNRDLRPVPLETLPEEPCQLRGVPAYLTQRVHVFAYGLALRSILEERWDLIHCWEEPYILAGCQVAWWAAERTPLVYATFQNLSKSYPPPFCWMERYCLERASGWIAYGETIRRALGGRPGYRSRPARVIGVGVDTEHFAPNRRLGADVRRSLGWAEAGPPVVGFLGRFVPEKGIELLLRVLERLRTPWRALFVGAGPLEARLRRWAGERADQARVVTGVRHDDVARHLNGMDVLCAPSQTTPGWREQFGRMLVEAFACGVPVVGSDSGEIPHVIGPAGLVVGENDEEGWTRTLGAVLESPNLRRRLAAAGRERAEAHFAWPVVAGQHLDFFEQTLEQSHR
jgi:glycosyltransferase involved in cell wall biosynthesis